MQHEHAGLSGTCCSWTQGSREPRRRYETIAARRWWDSACPSKELQKEGVLMSCSRGTVPFLGPPRPFRGFAENWVTFGGKKRKLNVVLNWAKVALSYVPVFCRKEETVCVPDNPGAVGRQRPPLAPPGARRDRKKLKTTFVLGYLIPAVG